MYVAGREHENRDPARRFLDRVRDRKVEACTSTEVLQEILYRYASLGRLDLASEVYDLVVEICPVVPWRIRIGRAISFAVRPAFQRETRFMPR
jgi:predicted nucleic acid-binding protein